MFKVNANLFRAVAFAISADETRYYLNGVNIEPQPGGGATLTATDGSTLLSAFDPDGFCDKQVIVKLSKDALKALKQDKKETGPRLLRSFNDGTVCITSNDEEKKLFMCVDWEIEDASFPDWRRVVPEGGKPGAVDWYNPARLTVFAEAGKAAIGEVRAILINAKEIGDPALIRFLGYEYLFGVLMPMRGPTKKDPPENERPAWVKPEPKEA